MGINKICEELRRHREVPDRHIRVLGSLGNDIGALTELILSRFVRDNLINWFELSGDKVLKIKRMHVTDGYDVDLYIETNKAIRVIKAETRLDIEDVKRLSRLKEYLTEKTDKEVIILLATLKAKNHAGYTLRSRKEWSRTPLLLISFSI